MKRRAFTLIELMIVIAILGIALEGIFPAMTFLYRRSKDGSEMLKEASTLTKAYAAIKNELAKSTTIVDCDFTRVLLDNDHVIRFAANGKKIIVGNREIELAGHARISDLIAIDNRTFSTQVCTGRDKVTVFWKVGAQNARKSK